jgi:hypothetical protein
LPLKLHVLMSPGCGHGQKTLALVREVASTLAPAARIEATEIRTIEEAELYGFRGSPTILVNGVDIEGPGAPGDFGLG